MKPVLADHEDHEEFGSKVFSCLIWLILFGIISSGVMTVVLRQARKRTDSEELQRSHALMIEQMEQIKRGEINCLIKPDPRFFDELLTDKNA